MAAVLYPTSTLPSKSLKDTKSTGIGAARSSSEKVWVDPSDLPHSGDISHIAGNAPDRVKLLTSNTFFGYAVGSPECFGSQVGKRVRFIEISINTGDSGRTECKTIQEATVSRGKYYTVRDVQVSFLHVVPQTYTCMMASVGSEPRTCSCLVGIAW
jgi:hypothetical protein